MGGGYWGIGDKRHSDGEVMGANGDRRKVVSDRGLEVSGYHKHLA